MKPSLLLIHKNLGFQGGAEQYLYAIAGVLGSEFQLHFAYERSTEQRVDEYAAVFDKVHAVGPETFRDLLKETHPALIYVHKCTDLALLEQIVSCGVPSVKMVHDHETYCMRGYRYSPWTRKICERKMGASCIVPCLAPLKRDRSSSLGLSWQSYRLQKHLVDLDKQFQVHLVGSNYMQLELERQGYRSAGIHIVPPVPKPSPLKIESDFSDENVLIFAGQVIRGKGLDCLLRALTHVTEPFKLRVLGDGSHRSYCEALAKDLGIPAEFLGFVPHEEMAPHYSRATALAFPSVWPEPFGAVGLEVMRWGIPVVGFDSGGVSDWLREGISGYLLPWMDLEGMAAAIDRLLKDKEGARRLGQSAQHFASEYFCFDSILEAKIKLFHSLTQ